MADIIVEDGTISDPDANSYVDYEFVSDFAEDRGVILGTEEATKPLIFRAMDVVEGFAAQFQGYKVNAAQPLQFPRYGVYIDTFLIDSDIIPTTLKRAVAQLVLDQKNGVDIEPNVTGAFVKRQKVGPIEREFSEAINTSGQPELTAFNRFINPLLESGIGMLNRSVRV